MKNKNLTLIIGIICLVAAIFLINRWLKNRYNYDELEEIQEEDEEIQEEDQDLTDNNKEDEKEGSDAATDQA